MPPIHPPSPPTASHQHKNPPLPLPHQRNDRQTRSSRVDSPALPLPQRTRRVSTRSSVTATAPPSNPQKEVENATIALEAKAQTPPQEPLPKVATPQQSHVVDDDDEVELVQEVHVRQEPKSKERHRTTRSSLGQPSTPAPVKAEWASKQAEAAPHTTARALRSAPKHIATPAQGPTIAADALPSTPVHVAVKDTLPHTPPAKPAEKSSGDTPINTPRAAKPVKRKVRDCLVESLHINTSIVWQASENEEDVEFGITARDRDLFLKTQREVSRDGKCVNW